MPTSRCACELRGIATMAELRKPMCFVILAISCMTFTVFNMVFFDVVAINRITDYINFMENVDRFDVSDVTRDTSDVISHDEGGVITQHKGDVITQDKSDVIHARAAFEPTQQFASDATTLGHDISVVSTQVNNTSTSVSGNEEPSPKHSGRTGDEATGPDAVILSDDDSEDEIPPTWLEREEAASLESAQTSGDVTACGWDASELQTPPGGADRWHTFDNGTSYLYAAHHDARIMGSVVVRVYGFIRRDYVTHHVTNPFFCRGWTSERVSIVTRTSLFQILERRQKERLKEAVFSCSFRLSDVEIKELDYLTITLDPCDRPTFIMNIHKPPEARASGEYPREFTVCLSGPLKFDYADVNHLTEWIELNRMFGAGKFFVYNAASGDALQPYLQHYVSNDVMEVLDWRFPADVIDRDSMWNFGQLILMNECAMRNMYRSKYVVYVDLDEVIVPRGPDVRTWKKMLTTQDCGDTSYISARNIFFRLDWPDDLQYSKAAIAVKSHLRFLLKTYREQVFLDFKRRSKYMVRPEFLLVAIVHHAYTNGEGPDEFCLLEPDMGALHHYRPFEHDGSKVANVRDRTLHRYDDELIQRVQLVHDIVRNNASVR